ncbi:MAG: hypothetical protein JJ913_01245 [Rhizobiaceae bacterium]|nr:hypothetical protein [Rhizobiaceae bacterium]
MSDDDFDPRWLGAAIPAKHWHFHRRLYAHYRIILAPGDFGSLLRDVQRGRARWLQDLGDGKELFAVRIRTGFERIYVVVKQRRYVVTVLPPTRKLRLLRDLEEGRAKIRIVRKESEKE